ncbi:MAG: IclR family transcriptional regulator [Lachnospiraceae bacterium]|nr:IclR family transcriptional regulator [Lachnospiraceae bacterium]
MENSNYSPKYPLHTLSNALDILNYIAQYPESAGVTIATLSKNLKMSKSSIHRILDTLLSYGFVEKHGNTIINYRLSWSAYKVGKSVPKYHTLNSSNYISILEELSSFTGKTATLNIISDCSTIIMYKIDPNNSIPSQAFLGQHNPLYATASGKLFMLNFSIDEIRMYFKNVPIKKYTSNTILNYIDFLDELNDVKCNDYAFDNCEFSEDKVCIAMPVRDYTRKIVATISISATPQETSTDELLIFAPKLRNACETLSSFLGA